VRTSYLYDHHLDHHSCTSATVQQLFSEETMAMAMALKLKTTMVMMMMVGQAHWTSLVARYHCPRPLGAAKRLSVP
jgi:hypothetical protein